MSARKKPPAKPANRDLRELIVKPSDSLLTAMRVINRTRTKLAFVADGRGRIVGTLGDGDVRRAILRGARVDRAGTVGQAMHQPFKWVGPSVGRTEVLDLMRAFHVNQLPVLDASGRMVGVHLLEELLGAVERPNRAVIMAGGKGTRLRPLTEHVPKPMLKVAGRPILERLVLHLVGYGIRDIFLSINYLGDMIENHFGDGAAFGCRIRYLRETKPLGTGGPLSLLPADSDHPILVMNGDLVTQVPVDELLGFHERGSFTATMCVRPHQYEVPFGVAEVDGNRLLGLREKPTEQVLANVGIYVLSKAAIRMIPKSEEYPITDLFETCLEKKLAVGAYLLENDWIDVGRPDQLRDARGES
jgi:dTDP-glucose pyrophosphorylase/predicted transcriptional regulator